METLPTAGFLSGESLFCLRSFLSGNARFWDGFISVKQ